MKGYTLRWLDTSKEDVRTIVRYLAQYSVGSARRFSEELKEQTKILTEFPARFPVFDRIPALRKMVVGKAVVFYSIQEELLRVDIIHVAYGGQDVDRLLNE